MGGTIVATANGVTSNILVNRPSWDDMKKNYPADGTSKYTFYPKISKALASSVDHPAYANTCALRMSYALNKSGFKLPLAPSKGGNIIGDDAKNYWLRVKDLKKELETKFYAPDEEFTLPVFPCSSWTLKQLQERVDIVKKSF